MSNNFKTVSLLNRKGGCNKSSVALGLASALAHAGIPTLLIDLDSINRTATNTFPASSRGLFDVIAMGAAAMAGESSAVVEVRPNLHFIAADPRLETASAEVWSALGPALASLQQVGLWRYCILDTPAGFHAESQVAARNADLCILPVNGDIGALESAISTQGSIQVMSAGALVKFLLTSFNADSQSIAGAQVPWMRARISHSKSAKSLAVDSQVPFDSPWAWRLRRDYSALATEVERLLKP